MKRQLLAGGLWVAIGILFCLILLNPPQARPVTPEIPFTPSPTLTPTPDPFCRDDFVVSDGNGGFACNNTGVPYKFIGINARELAYLGDQNSSLAKSDVYRVDLSSANPGILQHQLEVASQMGVKVIRIFAPRFYEADTDIHTLDDILTATDKLLAVTRILEQHHHVQPLKYLVTFTDFYAAAPGFNVYNLHCPGYSNHDFGDPFCYLMEGEPPHLRPEWFNQDYARPTFDEGSYRQYVETLIKHYNDAVTVPVNNGDPKGIQVIGAAMTSTQIKPSQIFAWELGNELKVDDPSHALAAMQGFAKDMACSIHTWDRYPRMVTSGFVSTFHATNGQRHDPGELYNLQCDGSRDAFDFGTIHVYNNQWSIPRTSTLSNSDRNLNDRLEQYVDYRWSLARQPPFRKMPYIVEELGFTGGNRSRIGERCIDGSYTTGDGVWHGDSTHGDGSGKDTPLTQTSITRGPAVAATIDRFFELGASGVMQWAFQAGPTELTMQDACRGMDATDHTDWADLFEVYCQKARQLDNLSLPCVSIVE